MTNGLPVTLMSCQGRWTLGCGHAMHAQTQTYPQTQLTPAYLENETATQRLDMDMDMVSTYTIIWNIPTSNFPSPSSYITMNCTYSFLGGGKLGLVWRDRSQPRTTSPLTWWSLMSFWLHLNYTVPFALSTVLTVRPGLDRIVSCGLQGGAYTVISPSMGWEKNSLQRNKVRHAIQSLIHL
jgi:hypothetical protein